MEAAGNAEQKQRKRSADACVLALVPPISMARRVKFENQVDAKEGKYQDRGERSIPIYNRWMLGCSFIDDNGFYGEPVLDQLALWGINDSGMSG